ncbi:hypothetical protein L6164_036845 [Bauhinia variegata]|uniref:Uncharacterized protein n=1 Tax=Bauhinia variegata TaxID=167791 RepID=A0ACB9KIA1_BAUVA|nr:hypothetical protein L6164_036845 [Bauhinia variegata]
MFKAWLLHSLALVIFLLLFLLVFFVKFDEDGESSYCGDIFNVSSSCDDPVYQLFCENNKPTLYLNYGRHEVHAFSASNSGDIQFVNGSVANNNCSVITRETMSYDNTSYIYYGHIIMFVSCESPVNSPLYVDIAESCGGGRNFSETKTRKGHYYYLLLPQHSTTVSDLADFCSIDLRITIMSNWRARTCNENCLYRDVEVEHAKGIELRWRPIRCGDWKGRGPCRLDNATDLVICDPSYTNLLELVVAYCGVAAMYCAGSIGKS